VLSQQIKDSPVKFGKHLRTIKINLMIGFRIKQFNDCEMFDNRYSSIAFPGFRVNFANFSVYFFDFLLGLAHIFQLLKCYRYSSANRGCISIFS